MRDARYLELKQILNTKLAQQAATRNREDVQSSAMLKSEQKAELIHQLLLDNNSAIINGRLLTYFETVLGYVLDTGFIHNVGLDYYGQVIDYSLNKNARLLSSEMQRLAIFVHILNKNEKSGYQYLRLLNHIICRIPVTLLSVCDQNGNTPLHLLFTLQKLIDDDTKLSIAAEFCRRYPLWMALENRRQQIALYLCVAAKNIDLFFCLCTNMIRKQIDENPYFTRRYYVSKMIKFGSQLLEECSIVALKAIFSTFDNGETFRFVEQPGKFAANNK